MWVEARYHISLSVDYWGKAIGSYNCCPIVRQSPDAIVWWHYRPNPTKHSNDGEAARAGRIIMKRNIHKGHWNTVRRGPTQMQTKVNKREGWFNSMRMSALIAGLPFCYTGTPIFNTWILLHTVRTSVMPYDQVAVWSVQWLSYRCTKQTTVVLHFISIATLIIMAALRSRCGHYIFALWFLLSSSFFISSPNLSRHTLDVYHTSTHGVALVQI